MSNDIERIPNDVTVDNFDGDQYSIQWQCCEVFVNCKDDAQSIVDLLAHNAELQTENLVMVTLLSGIAAGNNSSQDAAIYIKAVLSKGDQ